MVTLDGGLLIGFSGPIDRVTALATGSPLPPSPGVYAFFFKDAPSAVPVSNCLRDHDGFMLYVGIAPDKPGKRISRQTVRAMATWSSASSGIIAPGLHEVQERAVKLANENADAAFKLAKDVAQAKDLQELIDLQTRYAQSQMKWFAYQTQEFGRLMAKALSQTPAANRSDHQGRTS